MLVSKCLLANKFGAGQRAPSCGAQNTHRYTLVSMAPVAMATSTKRKGNRIANTPIMATGSCMGSANTNQTSCMRCVWNTALTRLLTLKGLPPFCSLGLDQYLRTNEAAGPCVSWSCMAGGGLTATDAAHPISIACELTAQARNRARCLPPFAGLHAAKQHGRNVTWCPGIHIISCRRSGPTAAAPPACCTATHHRHLRPSLPSTCALCWDWTALAMRAAGRWQQCACWREGQRPTSAPALEELPLCCEKAGATGPAMLRKGPPERLRFVQSWEGV